VSDQGTNERWSWEWVERRSFHPTQGLALEMLTRLGFPFSATAMHRMTEGQIPLVNCSYHLNCLLRDGLIEVADTQQRRGATEKFYGLRLAEGGDDVD
jgi:hypothetical protein